MVIRSAAAAGSIGLSCLVPCLASIAACAGGSSSESLTSPSQAGAASGGDGAPTVGAMPGAAGSPGDTPAPNPVGLPDPPPAEESQTIVACSSDDQAVAVDPDRFTPALGVSPRDVARQLVGSHRFEAGSSRMTLEIGELTAARQLPQPCAAVLLDVPLRVFEADTLLAELTATFTSYQGPRTVSYSYRASDSAGLQSLELTFQLDGAGVASSDASVAWHGEAVDFGTDSIIERSIRRRFEPVAELAEACAAVRDMPLTYESHLPFDSDAAAMAATGGTWILCDGPSFHDFAGVVIEGGNWHHLVASDAGLVERYGFGHEGEVLLHAPYDARDAYQIDLSSFATAALALSAYPEGLRASFYVDELHPTFTTSLVRMPVTAGPPELLFSPGQSAGAAGCATGERGLVDVASSLESTLRALQGRWHRCSGALPAELEFDDAGGVRALDEAGAAGLEGSVRFPNGFPDTFNLPGTLVMDLALPLFSFTYTVAFSETPRKLFLSTVIGGNPFDAVYSAE
jgi:hypothetical protein